MQGVAEQIYDDFNKKIRDGLQVPVEEVREAYYADAYRKTFIDIECFYLGYPDALRGAGR